MAVRLAHPLLSKSIPGVFSASFIQDLIKVSVPEADFTVRLSDGPGRMRLEFTAVFRELVQAGQPGGTWWNSWSVDAESRDAEHIGELLASELNKSRRKFAEALSDAQCWECDEIL
ncbi:hypothetical protein QWM81_13050 [Streptomyces ficellus]|uniref:Uncharacterized protein n=1 Tax=Streptomyces ficellus TaxID=1977088 RepID=A0ABT7Z636_9ACTN|nr:hypothetical protein [Streptomyces ficellus]MDN3294963.1 hypothetical protein [Streptomyces ficellus]